MSIRSVITFPLLDAAAGGWQKPQSCSCGRGFAESVVEALRGSLLPPAQRESGVKLRRSGQVGSQNSATKEVARSPVASRPCAKKKLTPKQNGEQEAVLSSPLHVNADMPKWTAHISYVVIYVHTYRIDVSQCIQRMAYAYIHTHVYVYVYIHASTPQMPACMHACAHTYLHRCPGYEFAPSTDCVEPTWQVLDM